MATTLPRISPQGTPLCGSPKVADRKRPPQPKTSSIRFSLAKAYELYPPRLPTAPDIPARVNPLKPPPPKKFNHSLETEDMTYQNYQRSLKMKRAEYSRYHTAWSKYYYGSPTEKEEHRFNIRSVLKQQMTDKENFHKQHQIDKVMESETATHRDMKDREEDADKFLKKFQILRQYTQANKTLMEEIWDRRKLQRETENLTERELLKHNPINWSCTLK
jgi:hypothetical protein